MDVADFFLACYLIAEGETLDRVAPGPEPQERKELFVFRGSDRLAQLIDSYNADRARVNPRRFADAILFLRERIVEEAIAAKERGRTKDEKRTEN